MAQPVGGEDNKDVLVAEGQVPGTAAHGGDLVVEPVPSKQPGKTMKPDQVQSEELARQLDRLWSWTFHEDGLLVNRMSVALLAQSILLVAAVGLLTTASPRLGERVVEIVFDVVGIVITVALWHVFALHADQIRLIGTELDWRDPEVYSHIHKLMKDRRDKNFVEHSVVRKRGTKWVMANVISEAILAIWLALFSVALASL